MEVWKILGIRTLYIFVILFNKIKFTFSNDFLANLMHNQQIVIFYINEGLGLLKFADTVLILINPSPSNVKRFRPVV